jgi:hypothetical protein
MSTFFNSANLRLRYEPFPIGEMSPMVDPSVYDEMIREWPTQQLFEYMPRLGNKYSLSGKCRADNYRALVRAGGVWSRFDAWVRSEDCIAEVMECLQQRHIDLGYRAGLSGARRVVKNLGSMLRGRSSHRGGRFTSSWEFQMMPGDGGHILPHTDSPGKIVTLTLSMIRPGEWEPGYGGGIEVMRPLDSKHAFNYLNQQADFAEMETLDVLEFKPNTGVVFIKTFNSWHAVRPMRAPAEVMRRYLIINIKSV